LLILPGPLPLGLHGPLVTAARVCERSRGSRHRRSWRGETPERPLSRDELLGYVSYCRARAREVLTHLRDSQLRRRCPDWPPHAGKTFKAPPLCERGARSRAWRPAGGLPGVRSGYPSVADATAGRGDENRNRWRISE